MIFADMNKLYNSLLTKGLDTVLFLLIIAFFNKTLWKGINVGYFTLHNFIIKIVKEKNKWHNIPNDPLKWISMVELETFGPDGKEWSIV